nr:firefly luciferase-hygromycin B phosphotransferase fusion protein [Cloning vector pCRm-luc2-HYG]
MEDAKNIKKGPAPFYPLEDGTAGEQLHKAMKRYALVPGTIAFTDAHIEVDITYAEYFEMSVRLAEAMKRYGLNTNHRIVVCSENSLQFFMPVLGALFIGVAVAPANDIYNERELLNSMGISQPTVVFVSKKGLQKILNVQKKLPIIQKIIIMDSKTDYQGFQSMYTFVTSHLPPGFNEYDFVPESFDRDKTIALIMNSSGSTGLPKGVALPHRTACVRFSHARDPIFGNQIIPDTAILSVVPFHHGFGMFTTLGYLICGFRVVLMYRFEEELFLRSLQDYKIQSALLVPTLFSFFAKSTLIDKYDLSNLHEIASGGAPLSKEVGEAVAKRFHLPGIRQGYGLTETTSAILITPEGDDKPGAVGKVVPFFEAKVVDLDTGKTLGVNQRGELCVRGPMIMSGYVNNPEATNALIDKDGWLHSGDIAYWDEDEHFFIVDRLKSLIKYKGYQVAPAELESILLQHPNIFDAGVAGLPDDDAGELPAAVVVLEHGKTMTEKEIVDYVASQVTTAKKLRGGVVFVDEVPKGLTGKLDARKIREILIKAKKGGKIAVGGGSGGGGSGGGGSGGMKKPELTATSVEKFLIEKFDSVSDLMQLSEGEESRAFSFDVGGRGYVLRVNSCADGFYKDRYVYRHFASAALPIPEVLDIGEFSESLTYCISRRAQGVTLQDLPETELPAVLQPVAEAMDAIAAADLSQTSGFGPFGPQGIGQYTTWRDFICAIADPHVYHWQTVMDDTVSASVAQALDELMLWAEDCPEVRHLVHADFGSNNVLTDNGRITAVIDWSEAMFGDSQYEVANIFFWRPWLACMEQQTRYFERRHPELAGSPRLRAYMLRIGLDQLYQSLVDGNFDDAAWAQGRCDAIVRSGAGTVGRTQIARRSAAVWTDGCVEVLADSGNRRPSTRPRAKE